MKFKREKIAAMIPERPVPPLDSIETHNKKQVLYADGVLSDINLEDLLKTINVRSDLYLFYLCNCKNDNDYKITDSKDIDDSTYGFIVTNYDILNSVKKKNYIRTEDGFEIFRKYDMEYTPELITSLIKRL